MEVTKPLEETDVTYMSIDEVLTHIGEYGRYQKLLNLLLFIMCIPMSFPIVIMYFSAFEPDWRCASTSKTCNFTGVFSSKDQRKCHLIRADWEYVEPAKSYSFVTQFDIGCNEKWKIDLTRSVSFAGWGIGAVVLGYFGDKYGRKSLLLPSMIATLFVTLVAPFLPNIYAVIAFRFFACFFIPGSTLSSFILINEVVGARYRAFAGVMIYATVPLGFCIIVLKSYLLGGWRMLGIACSVPYLLMLAFYTFIPESVQWLSSQDRLEDVMQVFHRIAKWNKKDMPHQLKLVLPKKETGVQNTSFIDIFRTRSLAKCSLIGGYIWTVIGLGYYGLLMAADDLGGSIYIDFFIMSITDLISSFNAVYLCHKLGNGNTTLLSVFLGGALCLAVAPIPKVGSLVIIRIIFGITGKYMLSISYNSIYLWSVDLYETNIRAKGMGWMQVNTRLGSTIAPWISDVTASLGNGAPFIAMGSLVILGAIFGIKLPRTRKIDRCKKDENITVEGRYNLGTVDDKDNLECNV